jgi:hypothetical protein
VDAVLIFDIVINLNTSFQDETCSVTVRPLGS